MRAWLGLIAVAACSSSDRPAIDASAANVCDQIAAVTCYDLACCTPAAQIADCQRVIRDRCRIDVAVYENDLASQRVAFDAKRANACLEALLAPEGQCTSPVDAQPSFAACATTPWIGQVAAGGACANNFECRAGNYCEATTAKCAAGSAPGSLPVAGQPCLGPSCALGFVCDFATSTCVAPIATGDSCSYDQVCASQTCLPGTCSTTGGSCWSRCAGTCASGMYAGQACSTDVDCYGHCSITTTMACYNQTSCPPSETCIDDPCTPQTCDGQACGQATLDYCGEASDVERLVLGLQP